MDITANQHWNPEQYAKNARFVSDLGMPVVELLAPRAGERILDLWVDPINEIEIARGFIPRLNHHQNNLSSHLHRLQHPASYLVRNDNLPNARPSS
jgi:hypothetical protein